jgi:hypothetical protein
MTAQAIKKYISSVRIPVKETRNKLRHGTKFLNDSDVLEEGLLRLTQLVADEQVGRYLFAHRLNGDVIKISVETLMASVNKLGELEDGEFTLTQINAERLRILGIKMNTQDTTIIIGCSYCLFQQLKEEAQLASLLFSSNGKDPPVEVCSDILGMEIALSDPRARAKRGLWASLRSILRLG